MLGPDWQNDVKLGGIAPGKAAHEVTRRSRSPRRLPFVQIEQKDRQRRAKRNMTGTDIWTDIRVANITKLRWPTHSRTNSTLGQKRELSNRPAADRQQPFATIRNLKTLPTGTEAI